DKRVRVLFRSNVTVIKDGLAAGDRVVLEGTDRLKDGGEVEVVNDAQDVPKAPAGQLKDGAAAKAPAEADKAKKVGA
ncbi:hypothetical protein C3E97_033005, partial [Pseudomonas sp. MWU12-2115]